MLVNQEEISTTSMMALNQLAQEGYPCHHGSMALPTGCKHIRGHKQTLMSIAISLLHRYGYLK